MHAYGWDADTDVGHAFGYFVAPDATATKYAKTTAGSTCGTGYAAAVTPRSTRTVVRSPCRRRSSRRISSSRPAAPPRAAST